MPSDIFKVIDKRYLIGAYAGNTTHGTMTAYESGLGFTSTGNNKIERATSTINYLLQQPNTDELLLDMLNHLFVENPYANPTPANETWEALRTKVLVPRGVELTEDGFRVIPPKAGNQDQPDSTSDRDAESDALARYPGLKTGVQAFSGVLGNLNTGSAEKPIPPASTPWSKTVFVVHGRDTRPVDQIETFLLFLGLTMMSWSEAVKLTGETQPHTYDIVKAGMDGAAAVVVVFSPDDEARVKDEYAAPGETRMPQGQARQNVLVEAGMAFVQSRTKTIFVQSEPTRPITDLEGFNWVSLDGQWDSRQDFINRLDKAGANPKPTNPQLNHRTAGEFKVTP
jgi:predicted nucleotide-binding protein